MADRQLYSCILVYVVIAFVFVAKRWLRFWVALPMNAAVLLLLVARLAEGDRERFADGSFSTSTGTGGGYYGLHRALTEAGAGITGALDAVIQSAKQLATAASNQDQENSNQAGDDPTLVHVDADLYQKYTDPAMYDALPVDPADPGFRLDPATSSADPAKFQGMLSDYMAVSLLLRKLPQDAQQQILLSSA